MLGNKKMLRRYAGKREIFTSIVNNNTYMSSPVKNAGAVFQIDSQKLMDETLTFMPNVSPSMPGYIVENLAYSFGNFDSDSNGDGLSDGWYAQGDISPSLSNNIQIFTPSQYGGGVYKPLFEIVGNNKIWYICVMVKTLDSNVLLAVSSGSTTMESYHSGSGEWEFLSVRIKNADDSPPLVIIGSFAETDWSEIQVKNVFMFFTEYSQTSIDNIMSIQTDYWQYQNFNFDKIKLINLSGSIGNFEESNAEGWGVGWDGYYVSDNYVENNIQTFIPNQQYGQCYFYHNEPSTDIIYACGFVKSISDDAYLSVNNDGACFHSGSGEWEFLSVRQSEEGGNKKIGFLGKDTAIDTEIQLKTVLFFNLTKIFGSGNEPNKEIIDSIIKYELLNGYFLEKDIKNNASMLNFAYTRYSGQRNFDRRVLQLSNLLDIGNFEEDTNENGLADGWASSGCDSFEIRVDSDGVRYQSFHVNTAMGYIAFPTNVPQGHLPWTVFEMFTEGTNCIAQYYDFGEGNIYFIIGSATADVTIKIRRVMEFDLTADFGSGNEPETEEITTMIADWFSAGSGYFYGKPNPCLLRPSIHFDGVDDYMSLFNTTVIDIVDAPLAIFVTAKFDLTIPYTYFVCKNLDNTSSIQYALTYNSENRCVVRLNGTDNAGLSEPLPDDGKWHNIGFIWDGQYVKMYVDGVISGDAREFTGTLQSQPNIYIGKREGYGTCYAGDLAIVTIYAGEKATEENILELESILSKRYITGGD